MIGGTVLGLVTFPATQEVKTIFVGTSIGLYLGIAIGVYYVFDRENASQALRRHASLEPPRSEDPGRVGRELRLVASVRQVSELEAYSLGVARPARVEVPVLRF